MVLTKRQGDQAKEEGTAESQKEIVRQEGKKVLRLNSRENEEKTTSARGQS